MLARQGANREQPLLQRLELGGIEIQCRQSGLDPLLRLAEFDKRPANRGNRAVKLPLGLTRDPFQPA